MEGTEKFRKKEDHNNFGNGIRAQEWEKCWEEIETILETYFY